jgi:replicative DNA helicase
MPNNYEFNEMFQRKILALAVRSDLLRSASDSFRPEFFDVDSNVFSPRKALACIIEKFSKENRNERPGTATMDDLVLYETKRLPKNESSALIREWKIVRSIKIPDPNYVKDRVRRFAQESAIATAVMRAAEIISEAQENGTPPDSKTIRRTIDEALRVGGSDSVRRGFLIRDYALRAVEWKRVDSRKKIPTGLKTLDAELSGGPARGEVFYILAEPKGSKTGFQLNAALGAARSRYGVAYFSYEMNWMKMLMRMDRNISRKNKNELQSSDGLPALSRAIKGMKAAGSGEIVVQEFDARKHGCSEAARVVEELRGEGTDIDLVVLDYLNIMSSDTREKEKRHELAQISREMSQLARELNVVVWSAALVNRQAVEKTVITKADIAESFEVIAVLDGAIAICGDKPLRESGCRALYLAALREDEDEKLAGIYEVDREIMRFRDVTDKVLAEFGNVQDGIDSNIEAVPARDLR